MKAPQKTMLNPFVVLLIGLITMPIQAQTPGGGTPSKWVQLPDLSSLGLDVKTSYPKILADDFLCTSSGPVTNIQIWGSWNNDYLPSGDPMAVSFRLSFHADVPDPEPENPQTWSMPSSQRLWEAVFYSGNWPFTFTAQPYATVPEGEGWYDPNTGTFTWPADYQVWQYSFDIPVSLAFVQQGSPSNPVVYWLDIEAFTSDPEAAFGWKTSLSHWNDDAVWADENPAAGMGLLWNELRYPNGHEFQSQSIDLAFVITPEPYTLAVVTLGLVATVLPRQRKRRR